MCVCVRACVRACVRVCVFEQRRRKPHCKNVWITSTCFGYLSCIEQQMICNSDAQIGSK